MTNYTFKLMGSFSVDNRGTRQIDISTDPNVTVGEVKKLVKKTFKMPPSMRVSLIVEGKSLTSDHHKWNRVVAINPRKDVIRVIGTR
ncbi:MAG: hypothetical protein GF364_04705 [Candidatus Lokiarchaeota archaeon]|nr:hypothetical protein [Candidatus Lokiarchaeota archaeon]